MRQNINIDLSQIFPDGGKMCASDDELTRIIESAENAGIQANELIPAITFEEDPDDKPYLILLTMYSIDSSEPEDIYKEWSMLIGRQKTYDYLKDMVKNEYIDPNKSFVVTGAKEEKDDRIDVMFNSKAITVYRFLKVMHDTQKVLDDEDFDIDNIYDPYSEAGLPDETILDQ